MCNANTASLRRLGAVVKGCWQWTTKVKVQPDILWHYNETSSLLAVVQSRLTDYCNNLSQHRFQSSTRKSRSETHDMVVVAITRRRLHIEARVSVFLLVVNAALLSAFVDEKFVTIENLCSTSTPLQSVKCRSKVECASICQSVVTALSSPCDAVNYRPTTKLCELYNIIPTSFVSEYGNCIYMQVRSRSKRCVVKWNWKLAVTYCNKVRKVGSL